MTLLVVYCSPTNNCLREFSIVLLHVKSFEVIVSNILNVYSKYGIGKRKKGLIISLNTELQKKSKSCLLTSKCFLTLIK